MVKERQSNFELCRLASILLVMLVHTTYTTLGPNVCFGVMLLEGFSIIGVNVFVMLTGYFSTSPKKSNLINLAFICLFWMIVRVGVLYAFGEPLKFKYAFFITFSNWFIPSYIGLLFLTPMLNSFCDTANKRNLLGGGNYLDGFGDLVQLVASDSSCEMGRTERIFCPFICHPLPIGKSHSVIWTAKLV